MAPPRGMGLPVYPGMGNANRYPGLEELEARVPFAGRAQSAAEALVPNSIGPYSSVPRALLDRIENVAGASGAQPRFEQQMADVSRATRGVLGGGASMAARMGAAGANIPGIRRAAARTYAEGAGNAAAQFAETAQRGTEAAAQMMQPLAAEELRRIRDREAAIGRVMGSAFGASTTPGYLFTSERPGGTFGRY